MPVSSESVYTQTQYGVSPETLSVVSARNRIYAVPAWGGNQKQIGVVANFNPTEGRTIEPVRGIGYGDRVMELVPGMTDPMTIAITRTAQYLSMIMQVFGYKGGVDGICRSLRHHKYPFDIRQELIIGALARYSNGSDFTGSGVATPYTDENSVNGISSLLPGGTTPTALQALITLYEACWMSDWSSTFASDTALVQEDVTVNVTDIVAVELTPPTDSSTDVFSSDAISKFVQQVKAV
jgi:hypothetical protein